MADTKSKEPDANRQWRPTVILTWICKFCGWANDNNNGPCRKCGKDS